MPRFQRSEGGVGPIAASSSWNCLQNCLPCQRISRRRPIRTSTVCKMENRFFKGPAAKTNVRADYSTQRQSLSRTVLLVAFYKTLPLSLCLQNRVPYQLFYLFSRS